MIELLLKLAVTAGAVGMLSLGASIVLQVWAAGSRKTADFLGFTGLTLLGAGIAFFVLAFLGEVWMS